MKLKSKLHFILLGLFGVALLGCSQHTIKIKTDTQKQKSIKKIKVDNRPLLKDKLKEFINQNSIDRLSIDNLNKKVYKNQEELTFKVDTKGKRGYLYVFTTNSNGDITVLYPNSVAPLVEIQGSYIFPNDFVSRVSSEKFAIKMIKECQNCKKEQTTIYTLLTKEPLNTRGAKLFIDNPSYQSDVSMAKVDYFIQ